MKKLNADNISNIIVCVGLIVIGFFFHEFAYLGCAFAGGYFLVDTINKARK